MSTDATQVADHIAWRRARMVQASGLLLVVTQAASFHDQLPLNRPRVISLAVWLVWVAILLAFLASGGGWLRGKPVRALLNDETTRDHRLRAMSWGFWTMILTALLLYATSILSDVPIGYAARLIITFGVALTLFRFGALEKRALRGE